MVQQVKPQLYASNLNQDAGFSPLIRLPANKTARQQKMAQVFMSLPPMWETRMKFMPSDFSLVEPPHAVAIWATKQQWNSSLSLSFVLCPSNK